MNKNLKIKHFTKMDNAKLTNYYNKQNKEVQITMDFKYEACVNESISKPYIPRCISVFG